MLLIKRLMKITTQIQDKPYEVQMYFNNENSLKNKGNR